MLDRLREPTARSAERRTPPPARDQRAGSVELARGGGDERCADGGGTACDGGAADAEPDAAPRATLALRTTLGLPLALFLARVWRAFSSIILRFEVIKRSASSSSASSEASAIAAARSLGT